MNLHEYQAKDILASFGVRIQRGKVAQTPSEASQLAQALQEETGTDWFVVKAQIHAGGRGKGGGVKLAKGLDKVEEVADSIIGMDLITPQTPPEGKPVHQVLIAEDVYYPGDEEPDEFYVSVLLNRATGRNMIMYSTEGGMDIEAVAAQTPERIITVSIDPATGLKPHHVRRIANALKLEGASAKQAGTFLSGIYKAFLELDASMIEINPLVVTGSGDLLALDAKMGFDDNALFRQKKILELRDLSEEDPSEVKASEFDLNYIKLDGSIGCMVNGAGLAMATMDIIKLEGAEPANFLDVGGSATTERVTEAFKIILSDENVEGILVNIFGGIMRCDVIAEGVVEAARTLGLTKPLVVRLEGTNVEAGKKIMSASGLDIIAADNLGDAAKKIVAAVKGE